MSDLNRDERLLAALVNALGESSESDFSEDHPEEESLAQFAAGALDGAERDALMEHLDRCAHCRKVASALVMLPDENGQSLETPRRFWRNPVLATWFALAASMLLAVGLFWRSQRGAAQVSEGEVYRQVATLLEAGKFDAVSQAVSKAEAERLASDRLKSLHSQATRGIPDPVALAYAGRLSDFGYEPGGIVARGADDGPFSKGAKAALEELQRMGSSEVEVTLNRGHALLTLGRAEQALADFDAAATLWPANAHLWLGRGLAHFMLDRFGAAADDFGKCLLLDPKNIAAKMNLALALDELGKREEALTIWRSLQREPLSATDQRLVDRAIEELAHD